MSHNYENFVRIFQSFHCNCIIYKTITKYFLSLFQNHNERAPENEWLDIQHHPIFAPDGNSFLLLAGIQESGTEHFTHIKHVTITHQRIAVISHGRYEVKSIYSIFAMMRKYIYVKAKIELFTVKQNIYVKPKINILTKQITKSKTFSTKFKSMFSNNVYVFTLSLSNGTIVVAPQSI